STLLTTFSVFLATSSFCPTAVLYCSDIFDGVLASNCIANFEKDAEKDFLKDKTMHLQLLFGQANRQDEPNDKKATSVVDVTL
ncbi:hypothetical protein IDG65_14535, partial [Staphylococcus sp. EG-SA-17]|uniref:hypothetical protein n=1 Tax=Staphylococcus sp. EG-SA-17 TaxID=2767493 RepID=UPI00197D2DE3